MGLKISTQHRTIQTKTTATQTETLSPTYSFSPESYRTDPCCYQTRHPNTKATQILDKIPISRKYKLKKWCLEEMSEPLFSRVINFYLNKSITCKCIYECSEITTQDIATLFKLLRSNNEQLKFLAQHIKIEPYNVKAEFYVRIKRQGNWVIRRTCSDTFKNIFRISDLELNELIKRIASSLRELPVLFSESEDDDSETELRMNKQQGYVTTHVTMSSQQVRSEIVDNWSRCDFKLNVKDLSLLDIFGFSNCSCESPRTLKHYLFHCQCFEPTRRALLNNRSVEQLYENEKKFIQYVIEFVIETSYSRIILIDDEEDF